MTPEEQKAQIEELILRYETQLTLPFIPTPYYKSKDKWEESIKTKLKELKDKLT
jgi:hypothetical protein